MARIFNHHARVPPDKRNQLPYLSPYPPPIPCLPPYTPPMPYLPSHTPPMPYVRFDTAQGALFDDTNDQSWADQTESIRDDDLGNAPSWGLSSTYITPPNESPSSQDGSRPIPQRRQDHLLGSLNASTFEAARIGTQGSYIVPQEDNVRFIPPNVALSPLTGNLSALTQDC
jgi:hypothetical protein